MNSGLTLTASQQSAIVSFTKFLENDSQVFLLKGAAGTGKTTLVAEFLNILEANGRVARLMAPTGRAASIIGTKTGKGASTIHRGIYVLSNLKSDSAGKEDDAEGTIHARFGLRKNDDNSSTIYIIDESSMVSDHFSENEAFSFGSGKLLTDLFDFTAGRKIVFVGDYAQLPPVGMNFSPALDENYLEDKFSCGVDKIELREVLRQRQGSVMLSNATRIRDSIEKKTFIEFSLENGTDSESVDFDLLSVYFSLSQSKPHPKAAIIAYSNRQALEYNLSVRRYYFGENPPRLFAGDLLMIARNNYTYPCELFNGNVVKVESCQPDSEVIRRRVRVKTSKNKIEEVELRFRKAVIAFASYGKKESLNVTLLDNFLDDPSGSIGGLLARALVIDFNNNLPKKLKDRLPEINRLLRSKEKPNIEQELILKEYLRRLHEDQFYNAVICKYGYAMTCHKAQGGEWDYVFVDMCRFGGTANEDYFRWAYTALTRASIKLWHYHSPDFNYISGLVVEEIKPSAKIRVSCYSDGLDFRLSRFQRIKKMAQNLGLTVSEDKSINYQHIITFTDDKSDIARFQLWYNSHGYSGKENLVSASSEEFSSLCLPLIESSFAPEYVPFANPLRPFAEKLVAFIRSQIEEVGIQLLDITQERYQDVFHLRTDGIAQIGLMYKANGNYTYMRLVSSLGPLDIKLQALRKRFI